MTTLRVWLALLVLGAFAGCSGGGTENAGAGAVDAAAQEDSGTPFDAGIVDTGLVDAGEPDAGAPDAGVPDAGEVDGGVDGGAGDTGFDSGLPEKLTVEEIGFSAVDAPMAGSFIYYGNWGVNVGTLDSIEMVRPDGSEKQTRFTLNRLWSFGVSRDAETIAFSSADPYQEQRFGVTIGDAIQYTWILRDGDAPYQLSTGNVNDECHTFMPGDAVLLMCRRANFWQKGTGDTFEMGNDPYRILTVDIATGASSWITTLDQLFSDIGPALRDDGTILFWRQEFRNGKPVQSLMSMAADGSGIAYLQEGATGPVASADGKKVLFRAGSWRRLAVAPSHDVAAVTTVAAEPTEMIFDYDFSPDMLQVVYTVSRAGASCDDVYVINLDGTGRARIVDCVAENRSPNGVKWVSHP